MNKIVNKFLLAGDKFMPELQLRQPGVTYSACRPFSKHCEKVQKFKETGNLKHIYKNEIDKARFSFDTVYSDSKESAKITVSQAYEIALTPKYDGYQKGLASMVYKIF